MVRYLVKYRIYDWHDGGGEEYKFVKAKNPEEALKKVKKYLDEWLKSFNSSKEAYYENLKVYEIRGPLKELRKKVTNKDWLTY